VFTGFGEKRHELIPLRCQAVDLPLLVQRLGDELANLILQRIGIFQVSDATPVAA